MCRFSMRRKILVIFAVLLSLLLGFLFVIRESKPSAIVEAFAQSEDSTSITLEGKRCPDKVVMFATVPKAVDTNMLTGSSMGIDFVFKDGIVTIPIRDEPIRDQYSIFILSNQNYLELVRSSQKMLKDLYDYDRQGGNTIFGRCSYSSDVRVRKGTTIVFHKRPGPICYNPEKRTCYKEINYAAGLLGSIWSKVRSAKIQPTNICYNDFMKLTFEEKMQRVSSGEFPILCQGLRDLFLHASTADSCFRARGVSAYNYWPHVKDLIPYSHAITEVYVEALGKWVLFDPWWEIVVTCNGIPVGAAEISNCRKEELDLVTLVDGWELFHDDVRCMPWCGGATVGMLCAVLQEHRDN